MPASCRNLVVCADGTWASPNSRDRGVYAPSNVVKLVKALRHGRLADVPAGLDPEPTEQLVFYDKGVGTGGWLDRLVGGATGEGLEQNVRDGYNFLVSHYQPGDRIYLVGFSRGTYTVRRVAAFLGRFGLWRRPGFPAEPAPTAAPDPAQDAAVRQLYAQFMTLTASAWPPGEAHLGAGCLPVGVEVLGVWDTVGALGLPGSPLLNLLLGWNGRRKHEFIDTKLSPKVKYAYHALALDEPREAFRPTLWDHDPARDQEPNPTLTQTWFAGAHSNVGGTYQECGLADIALDWMIGHLRRRGLVFREEYVQRAIQPDCYGEARNPRAGLGRLLYWRALKRVPPWGTYLHESVHQRGIPTTFFGYSATAPTDPAAPSIAPAPGLFVNQPPANTPAPPASPAP